MLGTLVLSSTWGFAQTSAQPATQASEDEDVLVLSPFEVSAEEDTGYATATTLAGNRLNTELRDIGNAVTVINSQFLKDIAATSNETLLQYTVGTEVGNLNGNFAGTGDSAFLDESSRFVNPNQNTRVRGLAEADNTRDYFLSDIPWDGYNVDRVDLQRGPNSILFGQGSPAGIINVGLKQASYRNANEVAFQVDQWGSSRISADFNRVLKKDELAVRLLAVHENEKFQQDPAFEDDDRVMGAVRWEPKFLRKGSARTIVKASFEKGDISSNRPRTLPPLDLISPWFYSGTYTGRFPSDDPATQYRDATTGQIITYTKGAPRTFNHLNKQTFNPHQVMDDNSGRPNFGQARPKINGGVDNGRLSPYFQPWLGNYGQQFGGPNGFFATDGGTPDYWLWEIRETRGINSNGVDDNGINETAFHRPIGIANMAGYAKSAQLPYAEVYKNFNLSDATVFDFYNNLLDGPNKQEWSDFDSMSASLAQTFMDDKLGFELVYNKQNYRNDQLALLDGERQAIYIDMMKVYSDGTAAGKDGIPFDDATPNPNVGRAFVTDSGQAGNRSYESERESKRATAFFTHDFTKSGSDSAFANFLGRHTFTGLWSEDTLDRENRNWQRYAVLDMNYWTLFDGGSGIRFTDNAFAVNRIVYLGDSLSSRSTASGAYLPRLQNLNNATSGTIRFFDSTWNASTVNPATPWANQYYPVTQFNGTNPDTRRNSFEAENQANYVGWVDVPFQITDSEVSQQNRDALTTSAQLRRNKTESKAFVWQAHLFDGGLVGTYGYRKDTAGASEFTQQASARPAPGFLNWDPSFYTLDDKTWSEIDGTSRSYSIVAHLDELPAVKNLVEKLPVRVTLFYNKAENFQPFAGRKDVYGEDIALPAGTTKDLGILLETKDGKYSLKVNKYETEVLNANSNSLNGDWFIGASQQWSGNWVNIFELNWNGGDASTAANPGETSSRYDWGDAPDREAAAVAAWRAWQQDPISKKLTTAWGIDVNNRTSGLGSTRPSGFAITEDSYSEGYEIELNAQPTRNWRLTLNASKTFATRSNIGGPNLAEFVGAYEAFLNKTAVDANGNTFRPGGDLRIWWGGAGNETALFQWNKEVGSHYLARFLQEGSNVPELREWRFNAISNYDFTEGRLKGFNVGAALRYQSDVVIGYPPIPNPDTAAAYPVYVFDIANPYKGPAETDIDMWVGYGRKLGDKVDWRIQLNVRSIGKGNDLIPITTQPDGTPAGYRIAPRQYWSLTNSFRF